jgi:hypothetical protein
MLNKGIKHTVYLMLSLDVPSLILNIAFGMLLQWMHLNSWFIGYHQINFCNLHYFDIELTLIAE